MISQPPSPDVKRASRFQGKAATERSQNLAGFVTVALVALGTVGGLIGPLAALAFFAIGAGSGYSLSGSV